MTRLLKIISISTLLFLYGVKVLPQNLCNLSGLQANNSIPTAIFRDSICSWLKPGVNQASIDALPAGFYKSLAQCMYNGTYDTTFRVQQYEPYPVVATTAASLKTGWYNQLENPTGIYFDTDTSVMVFVENTFGQLISLNVFDYASGFSTSYELTTGVNKLDISTPGLGYIDYYTDNSASLQPVRINITSGKVNGYYDITRTTSAEWKNMLANSVTKMIDLKGHLINLNVEVAQLKIYDPDDAKELVQLYDSLVSLQFHQMGLYKYNKVPKNHMYGEIVNGDWSWYAGGRGAHWSGGCDATLDVTNAKNNPWGLAHELGHVNQIRPGLKWVSTSEVTNNIYSLWAKYLLSPKDKISLEVEVINDAYYSESETGSAGVGNEIAGGRFSAYLNNGLVKGQKWLCQYSPDAMRSSLEDESNWRNGGGGPFVPLCPLWQLELYYQVVHPEKKDWYGDIAEKVRNTDESNLSQGQLMINFMKNACDVVGEDLTDFFIKVGMIRTYDQVLQDYSPEQFTITPADSASLLEYIAQKAYPKPESPVIYYLSGNSVGAYKNKLAIEGTTGLGCELFLSADKDYKKYIVVDNTIWKNVAVFETYSNTTLLRVSMVGSNYPDVSKTRVYYPGMATAIYAVGWDGSKKLVYTSAPSPSKPEPMFKASQTRVAKGTSVSFTDLSLNSPTSWKWAFYGGTPSESTEKNPVVTYNTPGLYRVILTATNATGSATLSRNAYINVSSNVALNKPVTVSSIESLDFAGSNATDGKETSRWSSEASDPQWILVDLKNIYNIDKIVLKWEAAFGKNFTLEVSDNGQSWTTIKTIADNTSLINEFAGLSVTGRYIRINGTERGTEYGYSLWELEVYEYIPPLNIALNKPAFSSSGSNAGSAVDGNTSTKWSCTSSGSQWISIDLQSLYDIDSVALKWDANYAKDYVLEVSTDGKNWTNLKTVTNNSSLENVSTGLSGIGRFIRMYATTSGTGNGYSLLEFAVNGVPVNIALNKPANVSSVQKIGFESNKAFDGDPLTRWSSLPSDPQWISVDLQNSYKLSGVTLKWEFALGRDYVIEISNDSAKWKNIMTETGNSSYNCMYTDLVDTARYIRMYGNARGTGYGYSLWEFEAYGYPVDKQPHTSIKNYNTQSQVSIYPNPARTNVNIDFGNIFEKSENVRICLMDSHGKVLIDKEVLGEKQINLNLGGFETDQIYFLRITNNNIQVIRKLVLIR